MATLIRPRAWGNQKPVPGSTINWGHPLAQGLEHVWLLNEQVGVLRSLTSGQQDPVDASDAWHPRGLTIASGTYLNSGLKNRTLSQATFLVRASFSSIDSSHAPFYSRSGAPGGSNTTGISFGNTNTMGYTWNDDSNTWGWTGGPTFSTGVMTNVAVSIWPDHAIAQAGASFATNSVTHSPITFGGVCAIGRDPATNLGIRTAPGTYELVGYWSRALSESELLWLNVEPYAFIDPPGPRAQLFAVASGASTVSGDAAIAGAGALAAAGAHTGVGQGAVAGSGAVSASGTRTVSGTAGIAGNGALVGTGIRTRIAQVAITGNGTLAPVGIRTALGAAALAGTGAISASAPVAQVAPGRMTTTDATATATITRAGLGTATASRGGGTMTTTRTT